MQRPFLCSCRSNNRCYCCLSVCTRKRSNSSSNRTCLSTLISPWILSMAIQVTYLKKVYFILKDSQKCSSPSELIRRNMAAVLFKPQFVLCRVESREYRRSYLTVGSFWISAPVGRSNRLVREYAQRTRESGYVGLHHLFRVQTFLLTIVYRLTASMVQWHCCDRVGYYNYFNKNPQKITYFCSFKESLRKM